MLLFFPIVHASILYMRYHYFINAINDKLDGLSAPHAPFPPPPWPFDHPRDATPCNWNHTSSEVEIDGPYTTSPPPQPKNMLCIDGSACLVCPYKFTYMINEHYKSGTTLKSYVFFSLDESLFKLINIFFSKFILIWYCCLLIVTFFILNY